jgi:hypothetical protein
MEVGHEILRAAGGDAARAPFDPTRARPEVAETKVMLYSLHPVGVYWSDDVRVEPVTGRECMAER